MSEPEQINETEELDAIANIDGSYKAGGQELSEQNAETADALTIPLSLYSDCRKAVDSHAAAGFEGYICVLDPGGNLELRLFDRSKPDAEGAALRQAKAYYKSSWRPGYYRGIIRVFASHNSRAWRTAFFMVSKMYRDEDFEHEHVDREWTYTLDLGPENPKCTIRFDRRFRGLSEPFFGILTPSHLHSGFYISIDVSGQLTPPESCNFPTLRFHGEINCHLEVSAFGSHHDPRYRVVWFSRSRPWPVWRYGPMFDDDNRRRSLWSEIRKHWPDFDDKSILRQLADYFRESIAEWLYRNLYDRTLGVYAPTLHRTQFNNRCRELD